MRHAFEGTLSSDDLKKHVLHELPLPAGAIRLRVRFEHPRGPGLAHLLCLSLFDVSGFRGSGHREGLRIGSDVVHEVNVLEDSATPGYLPGPILPGVLSIVIHAHRIVPAESFTYRISLEWEPLPAQMRPRQPAGPAIRPLRLRGGRGWLCGDLHAHTVHSDGDWEVVDLLSEARTAGLDFVALTDHNTISQLASVGGYADSGPLVIPGMELTTFHGHALSLGTSSWIDWGVLREDGGLGDAADNVRRQGGLFVIAHPWAEGDPVCTGCRWQWDAMMPGTAPAIEVWNGPWADSNERGLNLWYEWLNAGHRLVATAGSDAHAAGELVGPVGRNVVWSEARTVDALLGAIASGRLYLSVGPRLELRAASGIRAAGMGETLAAASADLRVRWKDCPAGACVRIVGEGRVLATVPSRRRGARCWSGLRSRWCVAEIRGGSGELLAVTNPVYLAVEGRRS